ncbi:MAG: hypothetical protein GY774_04865 [Planctomycetes bacterium]|nr:hypothetical protein [Planctomycetota bacterium]
MCEENRKFYPLKWWQLWRFNPYWCTYTYRFKWVRDLSEAIRREMR